MSFERQHLPIEAKHLPPELQQDDGLWERWVTWKASKSPNTIRALISDVREFARYMAEAGHRVLPADAAAVSMFLEDEARKGLTPATIGRRAASIASLHKLAKAANPCEDELVKWRLAAIRKAHGAVQAQAYPLRVKGDVEDIATDAPDGLSVLSLLAMLDEAARDAEGIPNLVARKKALRQVLLEAALMSLAYDSGLRAAELVRVERGHIDPAPDGSGALFVPFAKTDGDGEGSYRYLSADTVKRVDAWAAAAGIDEGPVFRAMRGSGVLMKNPMTTRTVQRTFKRLVERYFRKEKKNPFLPLSPEEKRIIDQISAHSTRVGVAQDALAGGEDLLGVMQAFQWKSPRMPARYGAKLALRSGAAARLHKKTRAGTA